MRFVARFLIGDQQKLTEAGFITPLLVGEQDGQLCMWGEVNTAILPLTRFQVRVFDTRQTIPEEQDYRHLGSVVMRSGLVWHVYQDMTALEETRDEEARAKRLDQAHCHDCFITRSPEDLAAAGAESVADQEILRHFVQEYHRVAYTLYRLGWQACARCEEQERS